MTPPVPSAAASLPPLPIVADTERRIAAWLDRYEPFGLAMNTYGDATLALRHFGLGQWADGAPARAAEVFAAALSLAPANPSLWADLAGSLSAVGDVPGAEACLCRSLSLDTAQPGAWLTLATLRNGTGDAVGAEIAFRNALVLDPGLAAAHFGLGLLCFSQRRLDEALACLRASVRCGADNALTFSSLGHVSFLDGAFDESVWAFGAAAMRQGLDPFSMRRYARALMIQAMIAGAVQSGLAVYAAVMGADAEEPVAIAREAFSILSAFGHRQAATAAGLWLLERAPDDRVQRYLTDAVRGASLRKAPDDYLERYFDQFAPTFDKQLVDVLRYNVPTEMAWLLGRYRSAFDAILDLGCGTGLAAMHLNGFGARLTGVDISGVMLEHAARRGLYADLAKSEAVAYLQHTSGRFDCIFAADMLIYVGDLQPLVAAAAGALCTGGYLTASIETAVCDDFVLLPSGRFAHATDYVERTLRDAFDLVTTQDVVIRLEANRPVHGVLLIARRRPS